MDFKIESEKDRLKWSGITVWILISFIGLLVSKVLGIIELNELKSLLDYTSYSIIMSLIILTMFARILVLTLNYDYKDTFRPFIKLWYYVPLFLISIILIDLTIITYKIFNFTPVLLILQILFYILVMVFDIFRSVYKFNRKKIVNYKLYKIFFRIKFFLRKNYIVLVILLLGGICLAVVSILLCYLEIRLRDIPMIKIRFITYIYLIILVLSYIAYLTVKKFILNNIIIKKEKLYLNLISVNEIKKEFFKFHYGEGIKTFINENDSKIAEAKGKYLLFSEELKYNNSEKIKPSKSQLNKFKELVLEYDKLILEYETIILFVCNKYSKNEIKAKMQCFFSLIDNTLKLREILNMNLKHIEVFNHTIT